MILNRLLKTLGIVGPNQFPELTMRKLTDLRKKVNEKTISVEDCELIAHYLRSIGLEGHLEKLLLEHDVLSFDEVELVYEFDDPHDLDDLTAPGVTQSLRECLRLLRHRIYRGEKIY